MRLFTSPDNDGYILSATCTEDDAADTCSNLAHIISAYLTAFLKAGPSLPFANIPPDCTCEAGIDTSWCPACERAYQDYLGGIGLAIRACDLLTNGPFSAAERNLITSGLTFFAENLETFWL